MEDIEKEIYILAEMEHENIIYLHQVNTQHIRQFSIKWSTKINGRKDDIYIKNKNLKDVSYFPKGIHLSGDFPRGVSQVATSRM